MSDPGMALQRLIQIQQIIQFRLSVQSAQPIIIFQSLFIFAQVQFKPEPVHANSVYTNNKVMDKPINQILVIKSLEELRNYLENKSNLNLSILRDKNNTTLLHSFAFRNQLPRIKICIKHYKEYTQLNHGTGMYTGESSFSNLLRSWVNSSNVEGYIPILYAALHGNLAMLQFLEECGSNMMYRTTKSENILFMCVEHNRIKALIYLLEGKYKYDINEPNCHGNTILHQACSKGHLQVVSYLLTMGADMGLKNNEGDTPLLLAVREGKKEVVKLLLIKGADRNDINNNDETPLKLAKDLNRQELAKILDDNYSCWDQFKIKCNKKVVYQPEKPSFLYAAYFIVLFHLFFLPVNILSQFVTDERYIKIIPLMFEGIYEILILTLYCLLFRKPRKKRAENLLDVEGPFCAECKRKTNDKIFHCYICGRCVKRYDHHCPWINNCVGAHNVGKFTLFLLILILGLSEVIFCSVCLLIGDDQLIRYRALFSIPNPVHMPLNILTIVFSTLIILGLLNLLLQQLRNLFTNSTGLERKYSNRAPLKKAELLSSQASIDMTQSLNQDFDEEERKQTFTCFSNCMTMLSEDY